MFKRILWVFGSLIYSFSINTLQAAPRVETPMTWYRTGANTAREHYLFKNKNSRARNVIIFIGDGMGISTITAARIYAGQTQGLSGEDYSFIFEKFPGTALIKTYSANQQTADSAPTATAIMCGVKTNDGTIGINHYAQRDNPNSSAGNHVASLIDWAESYGKKTGIVTTTRVTHATPASGYAHTVERDWESDADLSAEAKSMNYQDIAAQLIDYNYGDGIDVILGGGREKFMPNTMFDYEDMNSKGKRLDGRDLISEWQSKYRGQFVWNKADFDAISPRNTSKLLGLFERSHLEFEHDRPLDTGGEPSLSEMTSKAIDILSQSRTGYVLLIEGGRIDHAHHNGNAFRALTETVEFSHAIETALNKVNLRDTLIIVTADHSHTLTLSGYAERGNPVLGLVKEPGHDSISKSKTGRPYTSLNYANGPGYKENMFTSELMEDTVLDPEYLQDAMIPLNSETHGGEDVGAFAIGPGSEMVYGILEQNVLFHIMKTALFGQR